MTPLRLDCAAVDDLAPFFVLDALDPAEAAAVREHLATCSGDHAELAELGSVVPYLAEQVEPIDAPPELRARVLQSVASVPQPSPGMTAAASTAASPSAPARSVAPAADRAPDLPYLVPGRTRANNEASSRRTETPRPRAGWFRSWGSWGIAATAVLLVAALGAWNVMLQRDVGAASDRTRVLRDAIAANTAPGAAVAQLAGTGSASAATGFAAFPPGRSGYIVVQGLPPAPAGQTYQAWFLADGQPRSAGLLDVGSDGLAVLSGLDPGGPVDTVALTIERAGGVQAPTADPIVGGQIG